MTSKVKPEIPIELGGKLRHLKLDLNAMAEFEEATGWTLIGKNIGEVVGKGAKALRALLWASLLHEDDNLTLKEVGGWVAISDLDDIALQILEAFKAAVPEPKEDEKDTPPLAGKAKPRAG